MENITNQFSELDFTPLKETEKAYQLKGFIEETISDQIREWKFWVPKSQINVIVRTVFPTSKDFDNKTNGIEKTFIYPKEWILKKQLGEASDYFNLDESNLIIWNSYQDKSFGIYG